MSEDEAPREQSVAAKLDWLFAHIRDDAGNEFTMTEIANRCGMSVSQLRNIRTGYTPNPGLNNIKAISAAFGVTPRVFLDDDGIAQTEAELALLEALKRSDIRDLALRAQELGPDAVRSLARFIETLRERPGDDGA